MPKKDAPEAERRRYVRLDSVFPVQFRILSSGSGAPLTDWLQGFTNNVSKTGLCLTIDNLKPEFSKFLKEGEVKLSLKINMPLGAVAVPASAKLVWLKDAAGEPGSYLAGLDYMEISAQDQVRIMRYAMAKNTLVSILLGSIFILVLLFIISSCLNIKMTQDKNTLEKTLQSKIGALESKIKAAEGEMSALEDKIKTKEMTHKEEKAQLENKLKLEETNSAEKIKGFAAAIKKLGEEKVNLQKELVSLQSQETTKSGAKSLDKGDFGQAILDYGKAIELNPGNPDAYAMRADAYAHKGNFDQAITDLNKAIELDANDADNYVARGNAYLSKDNSGKATADFNKAIELDPVNIDAYAKRGTAYLDKGEFDQAIADFNKAIELNPANPDVYAMRGYAYVISKGSLDQAVADFSKAIELNPEDSDSLIMRGNAYVNKGSLDQAISDYSKAIELKSNSGYFYFIRANAYYSKKEYDKAWQDTEKAVSLGFEVKPSFLEELKKYSGEGKQ